MSEIASKPTLLFFPFDLLSHYLRSLELAQTIRDEYDIRFATSQKHDHFVDDYGFEVFDCQAFDSREVLSRATRFDFSWINYRALKRICDDQIRCLETYRPAAVIGDTAFTLAMASEKTETVFASLMNGYMSKYSRLDRGVSKAHPAARLKMLFPRVVFDALARAGERSTFNAIHRPFKQLRREYGLHPRESYLDELEGDVNFICDLERMFPQRNLPANYHVIGPLFHHHAKRDSDAEAFFDDSKPNLLVTIGSSGSIDHLLVLGDREFACYNILISGVENFGVRADHILAKRFFDHCGILPKTDLMICHGGNGTIYQALSYGVPVLCAPQIFEQEWNVQRIVELGLGASIDRISRPAALRAVIDQWLARKHDPIFSRMSAAIDVRESKRRFRQHWLDFMARKTAGATMRAPTG